MTRSDLATPKTLHIGTWNALRDRPDKRVRGDVAALLRDHPRLHALAVQEALDYHDVLRRVDGYRLVAKSGGHPPSSRTPGWSARTWPPAARGDRPGRRRLDHRHWPPPPWRRGPGLHHRRWLRGVVVHLPPSINWPPPQRVPVGPPERVDDYTHAMQRLAAYRAQRPEARGRRTDVVQQGRYGSDHPMVPLHRPAGRGRRRPAVRGGLELQAGPRRGAVHRQLAGRDRRHEDRPCPRAQRSPERGGPAAARAATAGLTSC